MLDTSVWSAIRERLRTLVSDFWKIQILKKFPFISPFILSYFREFQSINFSELLIEWEWIQIWMGLCRYFRQVSQLQDNLKDVYFQRICGIHSSGRSFPRYKKKIKSEHTTSGRLTTVNGFIFTYTWGQHWEAKFLNLYCHSWKSVDLKGLYSNQTSYEG